MTFQLNLLDRGHDNCKTHQTYRLSCGQYEELAQRSGGLCEMCGVPGRMAIGGKLHIDHDATVGYWAVRGLLCHDCNTGMHRMSPAKQALVSFLGNAWFLDPLKRQGITPGSYPEPPLYSVVGDSDGRHWRRLKRGWVFQPPNRYYRYKPDRDWRYLTYHYGPLSLHFHERKGRPAIAYGTAVSQGLLEQP